MNIQEFAKEIYDELGCGYSEAVYHNAFEVILRKHGIHYETERIVPITFKGHVIGNLRSDLIIEGDVVVELKSARNITDVMRVQLHNYLKLTGISKGMLINFPLTGEDIHVEMCYK
ncbi:hypothetical protein [Dishui Lake phycodnavirus 4]|nr:hypothetical protein [Dishui Lake phycodnavirus 4]